jgi:Vitamin K-dependent gamma-carboxylase
MKTLRSIGSWFMPVLPESRVAVLRTVLYLFVIIDIHLFVRDPIPLSRHPELYQPLLIERVLQLPPPSVPLTLTLYLILMVGCLVAASNVMPRLAGGVVAAAFTWWTAIGMSYGKVDHDHLALVIALWVLPTVGVIADRWRSTERSAQAGWALKCIQIAVVFTYFLSALTKIRSGGWSITSWPESSILLWAIVRRPHGLGQFLLPYPELLHVMQWLSFTAELTALVVLWLRGRALLAAAVFWMGFHISTAAILYIHFAPTAICWLAFAPLERLAPWQRRVKARWRERAGRRSARHAVPVLRDHAVDSGG